MMASGTGAMNVAIQMITVAMIKTLVGEHVDYNVVHHEVTIFIDGNGTNDDHTGLG